MITTGVSASHLNFGNQPASVSKRLTAPQLASSLVAQPAIQGDTFTRSGLAKSGHATHSPKFGGYLELLDEAPDIGAPPAPIQGEPPMEPPNRKKPEKMAIAQDLSDWLIKTLEQKKIKAAVVSCLGNKEVHQHDKTGMFHSGIAVFNEKDKQWQIYNLIHDTQDDESEPVAHLYRSDPIDFFYGQRDPVRRDALLLVPDPDVQEKLKKSMEEGHYKKMYFTQDYNLITAPNTARSLNCNKWVLMTLMAAQSGNHDPEAILNRITDEFTPGVIKVNPLIRPFAKQRPTILKDEVPMWDNIYTVTVESLHNHPLFKEKIFRSGKTMEERHQEAMQPGLLPTAGYIAAGVGTALLMAYLAQRRRRRLPALF